MKCPNCGGEIGLEALTCPYCGTPNEEARKHARDMQHYQQQFDRTQKEVTEKAGKMSGRAVRLIAIAVLAAAILGAMVVSFQAYNISYYTERNQALRNGARYKKQLDAYIEDGDYRSFSAFAYKKNISFYEGFYEGYYRLYRACGAYDRILDAVGKAVSGQSYSSPVRYAEYIADDLATFYETMDPEEYMYYEDSDPELTDQAIAEMESDLRAVFMTYLDLSGEDVDSLKELSDARRQLLFEDGLVQYIEGDEDAEE